MKNYQKINNHNDKTKKNTDLDGVIHTSQQIQHPSQVRLAKFRLMESQLMKEGKHRDSSSKDYDSNKRKEDIKNSRMTNYSRKTGQRPNT